MNDNTSVPRCNIAFLPSSNTDEAKWRRFFRLTDTRAEPLPHNALWLPSIHAIFLPDAYDRHRNGMCYEHEWLEKLSRDMDCPVMMPNQFPEFFDPYDYDQPDIERFGVFPVCAHMHDDDGFFGCLDMAWADTFENLFAVDDDGPGPIYLCAFAHLGMKQDRPDGSRYRHSIPYEAYLRASNPNHPKLPPVRTAWSWS